MRSLKQAKACAGELAVTVSSRLRINIAEHDLGNVVWQAISVWLDPTCGPCAGRGFNGGYDGPVMACKQCRGSGKRRGNTGKSDDERLLIDRLAMEIQEELQRFHGRAQGKLR
jgi:hypothetical protein